MMRKREFGEKEEGARILIVWFIRD